MSVALATMESAYGLRLGLGVHHHHHSMHHHHHHHHRNPHHLHHNSHHHHHQSRSLRSPSPSMSTDSHVVVDSSSPRVNIRHRESDDDNGTLRFSVDNILRPDFGRDAILSTRTSVKRSCPSPIRPSAKLPRLSPLPVPRDLSLGATTRLGSPRLSPTTITSYTTSHQQQQSRQERESFACAGGSTSPSLTRHSSGLSRSGSLESLASNRSSVTGCSVNGGTSLSSGASTIGCGESVSGESVASSGTSGNGGQQNGQNPWPAWVYCTRYSDRPSSGPRTRRVKKTSNGEKVPTPDEKRPRTAFSGEQLAKLKTEFAANRYLTEHRRQQLSRDLGLNEAQIKIWFQNKRAKIKKSSGQKNPLALQLMAQGLYNHSTVPVDENGEEIPDHETQLSS